MTHGLRATFDHEFSLISQDLVEMSKMVDWAIDKSIEALYERNLPLAEEVINHDQMVNQLHFKIEEACIVLIATQQPAAGDLRAIVAAMHIAVEMERMGDHAAGISKTVILMSEEPLLKTIKKFSRMAELSRQMLSDCIHAYLNRDTAAAREVANRDAEMDAMYKSVFDRLVETMVRKSELVARATYLMWCAHNLERIADRVTNIAEQVIFISTGDMSELNV